MPPPSFSLHKLFVLIAIIHRHQGVILVTQAAADESSNDAFGYVKMVLKIELHRPPRVGDKAQVDDLKVDSAVDAYPVAGV